MKKECAQGYDCDACKGIEGMTLRDWFAGMAMQGMLAAKMVQPASTASQFDRILALASCLTAEAMMNQRQSGGLRELKEFWVEVSASGSPLSVSVVKPSDHGVNCIKVREVVE